MFDVHQIRRTATYVKQQPTAARWELIALLCEKARIAARRHVTRTAGLSDFQELQATRYSDCPSVWKAIKRHTDILAGAEASAANLRRRVGELETLLAEEPLLPADLADAVALADLAVTQTKALRNAWEVERPRLKRREEMRALRFSTAISAVRALLEGAPAPDAETPAAPLAVPAGLFETVLFGDALTADEPEETPAATPSANGHLAPVGIC